MDPLRVSHKSWISGFGRRWGLVGLSLTVCAAMGFWLADSDVPNVEAQVARTIGHREPLARDEVDDDVQARRWQLLSAQTQLASLGFFMRPFTLELDNRTRDALGAFQARAGLAVTYALDKATQERLLETERAMNPLPRMPNFNYFEFTSASRYCEEGNRSPECVALKAEGSWLHPDLASPIRTNLIECDVGLGYCRDTQADVQNILGPYFTVGTQEYVIDRATKNEIVTRPLEFNCVQYVLRINRVLKTVSQTRSTIKTSGTCGAVDRNDMYMELGDGYKAQQKASDEARKVLELFDLPKDMLQPAKPAAKPAATPKKR